MALCHSQSLGREGAVMRAEGNDLPNATVVAAESRAADIVWEDGRWLAPNESRGAL